MSSSETASSQQAPSDRVWPVRRWIPMLILPLMILARFVPDWWTDGPSWTWAISAFVPFLLSILLLLGWWLGFSRALISERLLGLVGIVVILVIEQVLAHESMRGPPFIVMTIPTTMAAFSLGMILFGGMLKPTRTYLALFVAMLAAGGSLLLRNHGVRGDFSFDLSSRWSQSTDELLANRAVDETSSGIPADVQLQSRWPGFRGSLQDGAVRGGPILDPDWEARPPKELWRITVGPAWSSFASADKYLFTQEQRGDEEAVVCYDGDTGKEVWVARWKTRFFEGLGGLGPRATPAYADEAIYALGAAGTLVKLNARNGQQIWESNILEAAGRDAPPVWGFSASPLVVDGLVIIHAGGKDPKGILAVDAQAGKMVWSASAGEQSYGSVQVVNLFGKKLLALLSEIGAEFWDMQGQSVLRYEWPHQGYRALQPLIIDGDKLVIPTGMGSGTRLVQLSEQDGRLHAEEIWTSRDLKPDFNDVLLYEGHLYGFDNRIFTCIDLKNGKRKWKGGHYAKGQALLSSDSGLIVVVSEKGELVLLKANPEKHEELAKIPALHDKTWNHPVLIGNRLFLRNAAEAVAYELPCK